MVAASTSLRNSPDIFDMRVLIIPLPHPTPLSLTVPLSAGIELWAIESAVFLSHLAYLTLTGSMPYGYFATLTTPSPAKPKLVSSSHLC